MTLEQKRWAAERAEFESDTLLWEVPDADSVSEGLMIWLSWKARARIAHQREAELTAEIARLRDKLQLKCNPAEIATQSHNFLCGGSRYKVSFDSRQQDARIYGLPKELNGQWVALVDANDNCHINGLAPASMPDEARFELGIVNTSQYDPQPSTCRQRLIAEGKPYARSNCAACGHLAPRWKECDAAIKKKGSAA